MSHLTSGKKAEQQAASFLEKQGLRKITSGFRSRSGEIDLIMEDKHTLVFVEVKYRKKASHGSGAENVDSRKQKKLTKTALLYLQRKSLFEKKECRFDVVDISNDEIHWIKNAF